MGTQLNIPGLLAALVPVNATMGEGAFGFYGLGFLMCLHASMHDCAPSFLSGKVSRIPKAFPAVTTVWPPSYLSVVSSPAAPLTPGAVGTGAIFIKFNGEAGGVKMSKTWKGFSPCLPI